ncbi:maleylpyruvate isomerase family mycothiol-dependent enzyme [Actinoplanes sp. KI2]|uniref:maleylpyruvate isomerase family mycothiol-dependent enzyme n=1 Tax=Actinoplanes sp. KI2 TaxID=2983315 RepID=UPI0021D59D1D|nr:maleylpyruvate isomerase family mycothiol-dependent enzyme [Actinoplanes sp. KI2]MCU7726946.1 maleylpyruvate isomerase family mycothiol-dependent enzyme [Actinoplanes sp. KI2]
MAEGTTLLLGALQAVPDVQLSDPCTLPGWSRKHLVAHVSLNAEALMNLATWARTGVETPMYSSPEQRDDDIERDAKLPAAELRDRVVETAVALDASLAGLTESQWGQAIRTRQGREVTGEEIPWMRSREVMVHAADLGAGVGFADLPADFLASLIDDIAAKRDGAGLVLVATDQDRRWTVPGEPANEVHGTVAGLAAYLSGRETTDVTGAGAGLVPRLGPWL